MLATKHIKVGAWLMVSGPMWPPVEMLVMEMKDGKVTLATRTKCDPKKLKKGRWWLQIDYLKANATLLKREAR